MANVGYARVSSVGQSLEVQLEKLDSCDKIFREKASGVDSTRPELQQCLDYLREGDTLQITKVDRLARSSTHLFNIVEGLQKKGVSLSVLDQNLDTSTPTGKLLFQLLSIIAEFENAIRYERQVDGIKKAKDRGVKFGRRKALSPNDVDEVVNLREQGKSVPEIAKKYEVTTRTIYRALEERAKSQMEKENGK